MLGEHAIGNPQDVGGNPGDGTAIAGKAPKTSSPQAISFFIGFTSYASSHTNISVYAIRRIAGSRVPL